MKNIILTATISKTFVLVLEHPLREACHRNSLLCHENVTSLSRECHNRVTRTREACQENVTRLPFFVSNVSQRGL